MRGCTAESRRAGLKPLHLLHALPAGSIFLLAQKNRRKKGPGGLGGRPENGRQKADPLGAAPESRLAALATIRRAAAPRGQLLTSRSRVRYVRGRGAGGKREDEARPMTVRAAVGRGRPRRSMEASISSCRASRRAERDSPTHSYEGPLPRVSTTAQFLLPFFCASKKGSRRKGEVQK